MSYNFAENKRKISARILSQLDLPSSEGLYRRVASSLIYFLLNEGQITPAHRDVVYRQIAKDERCLKCYEKEALKAWSGVNYGKYALDFYLMKTGKIISRRNEDNGGKVDEVVMTLLKIEEQIVDLVLKYNSNYEKNEIKF